VAAALREEAVRGNNIPVMMGVACNYERDSVCVGVYYEWATVVWEFDASVASAPAKRRPFARKREYPNWDDDGDASP